MKILIIDLYGDNSAIRACKDTLANRAIVEKFRVAERKALIKSNLRLPQFTPFCEKLGMKLFCTSIIDIG